MNKKITIGIIGLATLVGVAGVAAATTYARGGGMMGRGYGFEQNATSTAAFEAQEDAMDKAIKAGDYAAWKTAADTLDNGRENPMTKIITAANFSKFAEMRNLMTQADAIRKEIGLDRYNGMGPGMMGGRTMMRGGGYGRGMMGFYQATSTASTNQ